jgi:DNA-binding IclR family transcriptional regulator
MRILESTHGLSPLGNAQSSQSDVELNLFGAASGLAFLAASDDRLALKLVDELKGQEFWSLSRFGVTPARLLRELRDIRDKGYAVRRVTQRRGRGRNAIAVVILEGKAPIGGLTISWQRQFMPADKFAALHLEPLRAAAKAISRGLMET